MHTTVIEITRPADPGYDAARAAWNLHADLRPAAVATARSVDDVRAAVRHAAEHGLRVAPTTTGHLATSMPALDGALLLRTALDEPVTIDPAARRARVPAGATWEQVVRAAAEHGLGAPHGSSPDVGVIGYVLGGGLSFYGRELGLASNHVTAIEVVDADGDLRRVDAEHDADLFWALRGGGGSLGVVCAVELELFAVQSVFAGMLVWPIDAARAVLTDWLAWTREAPASTTTSARLLRLPPLPDVPEPMRGVPVVAIDGAALDAADGRALVQRLSAVAAPILDSWGEVSPVDVLRVHGDPEQPVPGISEHALLGELDEQALDALLDLAGPGADCPLLFVELRQLGGALAAAPPHGGARARLEGRFALFGIGMPMDPALEAPIHASLHALRTLMATWDTGRTYLNFAESSGSAQSSFDRSSYARLAAVRDRVDPARRFVAGREID